MPSYATLLTLKKSIEHSGNVCPLTQKNLVQLDWVSKEDGSHILTVGVCCLKWPIKEFDPSKFTFSFFRLDIVCYYIQLFLARQ